jgi:hypothetical protein
MAAGVWQFLGCINPRTIVDVLGALLTPTIAFITTYVAYQQWRVNMTRLDLDLYDRRLTIYKAVDAFYGDVGTQGTVTYPMVSQLRYATAETPFLFPAEIGKHLKEVSDNAMRIATLREQTDPASGGPGLPVGDARSKACEEHSKLNLWLLQDAKGESRKRFGKYLKLTPG